MLKIALLGCGRISEKHRAAFHILKNQIQLVGVCDQNQALAESVAAAENTRVYATYEALLQSDCDIVTLCTPSGLHPLQTIQAAEAGKHVVTEKPMALSWQEGLRMVQACALRGKQLFVVKQMRYTPAILALKKALDENRFGKIYIVNCNVFWMRPQSYYDEAPWRGTKTFDGGTFLNQASHFFDLLTWLMGPVHSVQALTATLARKIEAEDSGIVNLQWQNGALGSINVTMLAYPKNYESTITILGEKGSVKLGGPAANEVIDWIFAETKAEDAEIKTLHQRSTAEAETGHARYYQNVIDVLTGKSKAETDGNEGLKSLELISAAYLAAAEHKTIFLPLSMQNTEVHDVLHSA